MSLNTTSLFSFNVGDKKKLLAARIEARAQRSLGGATKQLALGEEQVSPALRAERTPPPSTPEEFCHLRVRPSRKRSRSRLEPAFMLPPQRKQRSSLLYSQKVFTAVLESADPRKVASGPKRAATMERIQAKGQNLKHRQNVDSVPESLPAQYESTL